VKVEETVSTENEEKLDRQLEAARCLANQEINSTLP
jgi:hypothetical protein